MEKLIGILTLSLVLIACNSSSNYKSVYEEVDLVLENEQKWVIPDVMKVYMDSSMRILEGVSKETGLTSTQITDLKRQKEGFVSNCSMQGKGHDVLHSWLIPYIDLLGQLDPKNDEVSSEVVLDLVKARELYLAYFN